MPGSLNIGEIGFSREAMTRRGGHNYRPILPSHFLRKVPAEMSGGQGGKAKGENAAKRILPFALCSGTCLEAEAQPQTNGPAIIDALVLIALIELSEKRVEIDLRNRQELPGNWINI